jgi:hypothetical protein
VISGSLSRGAHSYPATGATDQVFVLTKRRVSLHASPVGPRPTRRTADQANVELEESVMNNIIWLVGAVVIVLFALGYFGLR